MVLTYISGSTSTRTKYVFGHNMATDTSTQVYLIPLCTASFSDKIKHIVLKRKYMFTSYISLSIILKYAYSLSDLTRKFALWFEARYV